MATVEAARAFHQAAAARAASRDAAWDFGEWESRWSADLTPGWVIPPEHGRNLVSTTKNIP